jgi:hypothetical protein
MEDLAENEIPNWCKEKPGNRNIPEERNSIRLRLAFRQCGMKHFIYFFIVIFVVQLTIAAVFPICF